MFFSFIMAIVVALTPSLAIASTLPDGVTIAESSAFDLPLPVVPFQISGIFAGYEVEFNGTVQELVAHVQALHPEFRPQDLAANMTARLAPRRETNYYCCPVPGWNWGQAELGAIDGGIYYLDNLTGPSSLCSVPGSACTRVSCSYNSAIYMCNDNPYVKAVGCYTIAKYAYDLVTSCLRDYPYTTPSVCGQQFDDARYNVVVRRDSC